MVPGRNVNRSKQTIIGIVPFCSLLAHLQQWIKNARYHMNIIEQSFISMG